MSSVSSNSPETWSEVEHEALRVAQDPVLERMLADERVEASAFDTTLLMKLVGYARGHRSMAALAILLSFFEAGLMTLPAYLIGLAVDRIQNASIREDRAFDSALLSLVDRAAPALGANWAPLEATVLVFSLLVVGVWLARWLAEMSATYLMQRLGQFVVHDLRVDIYRHILSMDMGFFHRNPIGRLVNRTTFDTQAISELFADAFARGLRDILFVLALMMVMLKLDAVLGGVLLSIFPVLVAIALTYRHFARPALRTMTAVQSRINSWMAENLAGMRENQLFRRELRRRAEIHQLTEAHQSSVERVIQSWGLLRPAMLFATALGTAAVLYLGYGRVTGGLMSVGILVTFLQYTTRLWVPVRNLTEKFNLIQTALTSGERIMDILNTPSMLTDSAEAKPLARIERGAIAFRNVSFRYPGKEKWALREFTFKVDPGSTVALVGNTGAGKSTVVHLLSRFYDINAGEIVIDGRTLPQYTLSALRAGIALVPQDVALFAGTLRENITLGLQISDDEILRSARAVCADRVIARFERGLDHVLDEGGRTLSAGERQLLSFARALVFEPPILVLDEATANVDTHTERLIQEALSTLTHDRTSIVIAHRLSTIRDASQILVLDDGHIIERGTHDELLDARGPYAELYALHTRGHAP